tara:strand:+ start:67 stop:426 length:360 start_codon:yes stop_codon:yes gene_type:complete
MAFDGMQYGGMVLAEHGSTLYPTDEGGCCIEQGSPGLYVTTLSVLHPSPLRRPAQVPNTNLLKVSLSDSVQERVCVNLLHGSILLRAEGNRTPPSTMRPDSFGRRDLNPHVTCYSFDKV